MGTSSLSKRWPHQRSALPGAAVERALRKCERAGESPKNLAGLLQALSEDLLLVEVPTENNFSPSEFLAAVRNRKPILLACCESETSVFLPMFTHERAARAFYGPEDLPLLTHVPAAEMAMLLIEMGRDSIRVNPGGPMGFNLDSALLVGLAELSDTFAERAQDERDPSDELGARQPGERLQALLRPRLENIVADYPQINRAYLVELKFERDTMFEPVVFVRFEPDVKGRRRDPIMKHMSIETADLAVPCTIVALDHTTETRIRPYGVQLELRRLAA